MLKFVYNFRTRGVRESFVWRDIPDQLLPGTVHYFVASLEEYGGLMVIFICMDISVIFLSSIALDLGHKRLALDWNLQHGI